MASTTASRSSCEQYSAPSFSGRLRTATPQDFFQSPEGCWQRHPWKSVNRCGKTLPWMHLPHATCPQSGRRCGWQSTFPQISHRCGCSAVWSSAMYSFCSDRSAQQTVKRQASRGCSKATIRRCQLKGAVEKAWRTEVQSIPSGRAVSRYWAGAQDASSRA